MAVDYVTFSSRDFTHSLKKKNLSNSGQWTFVKTEMKIMIV